MDSGFNGRVLELSPKSCALASLCSRLMRSLMSSSLRFLQTRCKTNQSPSLSKKFNDGGSRTASTSARFVDLLPCEHKKMLINATSTWLQLSNFVHEKSNLPLRQLNELGVENLESPPRDIRGRLQIRRPGQPTKSTKRCRSFR